MVIYNFKNAADKLIVIYMEDDKKWIKYAQILSNKGFDNLFLLSGGISKFMN